MSEKYEGYNFRLKDSLLGVQFLFVAFGALVLVPILTGLDTNVALFTAGIGTLVFQLCTRKQVVPIFWQVRLHLSRRLLLACRSGV